MTALESACNMIITDSGGVQKESYFLEKPCIVLRPQTEWVELVETGTAVLADADPTRILAAHHSFRNKSDLKFPHIFGDGKAASFILAEIIKNLQPKGSA